jgi:hypothetical protein
LSDHYIIPGLSAAISKLLITFSVNSSFSIFKDKKLTQKLGTGEVRSFPKRSLALFFVRDTIAMFSAFTVPPILAKYLQKETSMKENTAVRAAQIVAPVSIQIFATPIHLLGLDLYNRPDV